MMPCCASVLMMRLASHPQIPPTMSQMMIAMSFPSCSGAVLVECGRSGTTDAWRGGLVPDSEGSVQIIG
jgi:hypothetical protein